jgi:hypothetical protein
MVGGHRHRLVHQPGLPDAGLTHDEQDPTPTTAGSVEGLSRHLDLA